MRKKLAIMLSTGCSALTAHHLITKPEPFPVTMNQPEIKLAGLNIFPIVHKLNTLLPDKLRKFINIQQSVPSAPPRDRFDFTGESPYHINEVVSGRLWKVGYDMELMLLTDSKARQQFSTLTGIDAKSERFYKKVLAGAKTQGEDFVSLAKRDLQKFRDVMNEVEIGTCNIQDIPFYYLNAFVAKLKSGGLLLYAPVKVREDLKVWLDKLGPVEWIVVASSAHTLHLKDAIEQYPNAKVVGSKLAETKLKATFNLPRDKFDYLSTSIDELAEVNKILSEENCKLFCISGDVLCDAMFVKFEDTLLECDVIYGHHDGVGMSLLSKEEFLECHPEHWFARLFKFGLVNKPNSPQGFLPSYRYWMMDPNSVGGLLYNTPAKDGSSCTDMAGSLRQILKLDFKRAVGVHIPDMERDDFCKSVDKNWKWLDGKSLL